MWTFAYIDAVAAVHDLFFPPSIFQITSPYQSFFFLSHLPLVAIEDNFIKMDGSVCSGAGGALCLVDLNVFFPAAVDLYLAAW